MKRILIPAGGAILATGMLAAGLAGTATATVTSDVAKDPMATSAANAKAIADYWAASNGAALKAAKESNVWSHNDVAKLQSKGGYSSDTKPGSTKPIGEETKSSSKSQNVNMPKTIGKVFFVNKKGERKWCSATSIQSKYRNLVATAGHCVYDTSGNTDVMDKWVFVPGYYQGKAPWGIYVGKTAYTHYDFEVYEDYDRDYAFVAVYNGVKIGGGTPKKVSKSEWDKFDGVKEAKDVEISEAEYQKCKDYHGGETPDCWAKASKNQDVVGPDYKGAIKVLKEVSKDEYTAAPTGKRNGAKAVNATVVEHVTQSQYKAYKGPGYQKIDDKGNYTITHYFTKYWVKETSSIKYYKTTFYVIDGFIKDAGRLGDNVGGQGFSWNQPTQKIVRVFGYPAGPHPDGHKNYTGTTPKWCYGKTTKKLVGSASKKIEEHVALKCAMTEGADGGPWLLNYSNSKRLGYVNGVTSTFNDQDNNNRVDYISSPYFDGETNTVYKAAANVWSGKIV
ncbi:trypsin-like serine peptidase [Nonomuraea sp. NPDC049714]|uniref:trypsin-like serine peptidase n=1 Tax=Nonomuraea sp. NPDC049714 TaxID=3364357 RepID=UPI0037AEDCFE